MIGDSISPAPTVGLRHHVLAVLLAAAGGVFGVAGAIFEEVRAGGFILLVIVGAPVIEELLKPSGVYLFVGRWPHVARPQLYVAFLAALGGLSFGAIESLLYVTLYAPDHSAAFFIYRFTATVLLHAGFSFIAGLGISPALLGWANGRNPFPKASRNAFAAAMLLHALYNTTAVALSFAGVLDFD